MTLSRIRAAFAALVLLALLGGACAQRHAEVQPADSRAAQETRLEGVLRNTGTAPVGREVVLRGDEGASTPLDGALTTELSRLAGARVAVWGHTAERGHLVVSRYEILSIDGAPARVGTAERVEGDTVFLRTSTGELLRLPGFALLDRPVRAGQKVWIQGTEEKQTGGIVVRVHKFGILTP